MAGPIIFYDIPRAHPTEKCWSPNLWKTRYTLNFKGLPYKTVWVEYPDVEPLCKKLGAASTGKWPDGTDFYTLPVIHDPSTNKVVSDSLKIAKYLDEQYPDTPTLVPAGTLALQKLFVDWIWEVHGMPVFTLLAATACAGLNPASQKHFREKREWQVGGVPLEALVQEETWVAVEGGLARLKGYYEANGKGKDLLLGGDHVTFADIQMAANLVSVRLVAPQMWERIGQLHDGKWAKVLEQFKAWEAVDV